MLWFGLITPAAELGIALAGLSSARARRRRVFPVLLTFDPSSGSLRISEDRGPVAVEVPAQGDWSPTGATVDLHLLSRAARSCASSGEVAIRMLEDALLVSDGRLSFTLYLLEYGPRSSIHAPNPAAPVWTLPLFAWAARQDRRRS